MIPPIVVMSAISTPVVIIDPLFSVEPGIGVAVGMGASVAVGAGAVVSTAGGMAVGVVPGVAGVAKTGDGGHSNRSPVTRTSKLPVLFDDPVTRRK